MARLCRFLSAGHDHGRLEVLGGSWILLSTLTHTLHYPPLPTTAAGISLLIMQSRYNRETFLGVENFEQFSAERTGLYVSV